MMKDSSSVRPFKIICKNQNNVFITLLLCKVFLNLLLYAVTMLSCGGSFDFKLSRSNFIMRAFCAISSDSNVSASKLYTCNIFKCKTLSLSVNKHLSFSKTSTAVQATAVYGEIGTMEADSDSLSFLFTASSS